jgi:hypothetical protein
MKRPESSKGLPLAIIKFARTRLQEMTAARARTTRPWYARHLLRETLSASFVVSDVVVRQFANCDVIKRLCSGDTVGCWIIDEYEVIDADQISRPYQGEIIYEAPATLLNFAVEEQGTGCVVVEIDMEGLLRRSVFDLPSAANSCDFSAQRGETWTERVDRKAWNPLLPNGGL